MTKEEVKVYFSQIRKEQYEISHLKTMISNMEFELLPSGIRYDKDKVQTSPDDTMSRVLAKAMDMQKELENSIAKLQERQIKAEKLIQSLENSDEREVMRYYYMDLEDGKPLTWEQVAIRINYYKRHVLRIHGNALYNLSRLTSLEHILGTCTIENTKNNLKRR